MEFKNESKQQQKTTQTPGGLNSIQSLQRKKRME